MKTTKFGAVIMAGMFLFGTASVAMAKGPGGYGRGAAVRSGAGTASQNQIRKQQRLRDGSCVNQGTGTPLKKGSAYGPGDGTGTGVPAQDGTGYGAPANR
jgi:hypothetical protein